jgi:predicted RNase H-like HicB family nuclease
LLRKFKVLLEYNEEEGGYTVTVPALPGCITEGKTVEEALENTREAITGFLEALEYEESNCLKKNPSCYSERLKCMTPRLTKISGKNVKRALLKAGFREVHTRTAITTWDRLGWEVRSQCRFMGQRP